MKRLCALMLTALVPLHIVGGLSMQDILRNTEITPDVRLTELRRDSTVLALERSSALPLPALNLTPAARASGGPEITDLGRISLAGSLALSVPFGLTTDQRDRIAELEDTLRVRDQELDAASRDTMLNLVRLYQTTWVQQSLLGVQEAERDVIRMQYNADVLRFERGEIALTTLLRSEQELTDAEAAVLRSRSELDVQMQRLELQTRLSIQEDTLAPPPVFIYDHLAGQFDVRSVDLNLLQRQSAYESVLNLSDIQTNLFELSRVSASVSRESVYGELGASLSGSPVPQSATLSYGTPDLLLFGESPQVRDATWNASLQITVSVRPDNTHEISVREQDVEIETARYQLLDAERRVDEAEQRVRTDLRRAVEAVHVAEAQLTRSIQTRETVEVQLQTGRATAIDVRVAEAAILRHQHLLDRALLEREDAAVRANPAGAYQLITQWLSGELEVHE